MLLPGFELCCMSCWPAPFLAGASSLPLLNRRPLSGSLASPSPSLFAAILELSHSGQRLASCSRGVSEASQIVVSLHIV